MILGILFYLMQAHEFLQEGMTYKLGCSFYLAWIGVFLFLITGLRWGGVGFGVWACVRGCRWGQGGIGFGMGRGLWTGRTGLSREMGLGIGLGLDVGAGSGLNLGMGWGQCREWCWVWGQCRGWG